MSYSKFHVWKYTRICEQEAKEHLLARTELARCCARLIARTALSNGEA